MGYWQSLPMCEECWNSKNPERLAITLNNAISERCRWCNSITRSGIYVREDVRNLPG